MKYQGNTISKPVVGKEAERLIKAIESGGYLCNEQAMETIRRVADNIRSRKLIKVKYNGDDVYFNKETGLLNLINGGLVYSKEEIELIKKENGLNSEP